MNVQERTLQPLMQFAGTVKEPSWREEIQENDIARELLKGHASSIRFVLGTQTDVSSFRAVQKHITGIDPVNQVMDHVAEDPLISVREWQDDSRNGIEACLNPVSLKNPAVLLSALKLFFEEYSHPDQFVQFLSKETWDAYMKQFTRHYHRNIGNHPEHTFERIAFGECGELVMRMYIQAMLQKFTNGHRLQNPDIPNLLSGVRGTEIEFPKPAYFMKFFSQYTFGLHRESDSSCREFDGVVTTPDCQSITILDASASYKSLSAKLADESWFENTRADFKEANIALHKAHIYLVGSAKFFGGKSVPDGCHVLSLPALQLIRRLSVATMHAYTSPTSFKSVKKILRTPTYDCAEKLRYTHPDDPLAGIIGAKTS